MARTAQNTQEARSTTERVADYEARYVELQNAARRVLLEVERVSASPEARAFVAHGSPWLPIWQLKAAIDAFEAAQQALLPSPTFESSTVPMGQKG